MVVEIETSKKLAKNCLVKAVNSEIGNFVKV